MAKKKYDELSQQILDNVGGKENITTAFHCETRLRMTVKDRGLINKEGIDNTKGILGSQFVGDQFQIIIGQHVDLVYRDFCELADIKEEEAIAEEVEENVNKKSVKYWLSRVVLKTINGCIMPILPIFVCAGIIKMLVVFLGPSIFGLFAADSDVITTLTLAGDAGFYFLPIFAAWSAGRYFKTSIPMALFVGAIYLHPTITGIVNAGAPFSVFGVPMTLVGYANQLLPTIISVAIMSYIYEFLNTRIPSVVKMAVVPTLTLLIMLPISLCIVGPIGTYCGILISNVAVAINTAFGPLAIGLIGGLWYILVGLGMDKALIPVVINNFTVLGYDNLFWLSAIFATYALIGVSLAYFIRCRKEERASAGSNAVTLMLGGISEPIIFGVLWRFRRAVVYLFAGGFVGGFIGGLFQVKAYAPGTGNIIFAAVCAGEGGSGLIPAIAACAIAFGISFVLGLVFGFDNKKETLETA